MPVQFSYVAPYAPLQFSDQSSITGLSSCVGAMVLAAWKVINVRSAVYDYGVTGIGRMYYYAELQVDLLRETIHIGIRPHVRRPLEMQ